MVTLAAYGRRRLRRADALCAPAACEEWTAHVVSEIKALTGSCVVIPCTFTYPGIQRADSQLRGMWFREKYQTKIDDIKDHDTDKYCYRTEIPEHDKYSYNHACVTVNTYKEVPEPKVTHQGDPVEGSPHIFMCTIYHTCPSNIPKLTWSGRTEQEPIIQHKDIGQGKWEIMSILTFIPKEEDDHTDLTCTVEYHGKVTFSRQLRRRVPWHVIPPSHVTTGPRFDPHCRRNRQSHIAYRHRKIMQCSADQEGSPESDMTNRYGGARRSWVNCCLANADLHFILLKGATAEVFLGKLPGNLGVTQAQLPHPYATLLFLSDFKGTESH
ncbi:hypothetical protein JZ751_006609 [Albula glossodonta]|uniref:Ig-like domain-containing protein n=1 Tax=Albula glossodonta TaxID=121402 RepID=A0A8T2MNQ8_9TELE|nr:hypothetical protein JZ751_006609 [Albula glossodonta]